MKYAWIKQHRDEFAVLSMCRFLQVSQSAYYGWLHRVPSFREQEDEQLSGIVKNVFEKSRNTYGTRRHKIAMFHQGRSVGRRIGRLMKEAGLVCKTKRQFKVTTNSKYNLPIAPNYLDRQFSIDQINQVYAGDITYIHTLEGWLYLAVVIDLFSRQALGWSIAAYMKTQLVNNALQMAIWKRKPDKGLLWHTDQGSQYAAESHRQLLKQNGMQQSMSRKGNCCDNAVSESFFHTLKTELIHQQTFHSRGEAKLAVFEYIEVFYNWERLHSANGYISPVDFELQQNAA